MSEDTSQKGDPISIELDLSDLVELSPSETAKAFTAPFSASIEMAANANSKRLAAAESRVAAAEIETGLIGALDQMYRATVAGNPRLANYVAKANVIMFRKAPKGLYKEPGFLVQSWLELPHTLGARTGKQIVEGIQDRYFGHTVRKDFMSRRLHWAQSKHLRAMLAGSGISTKPADCQTLSRVRLRLQNHFNPPEYETHKVVIKFASDGGHVIWNGHRYSVFLNSGVPTIKRLGKRVSISSVRRIVGSE